jgi:glutathione synthase
MSLCELGIFGTFINGPLAINKSAGYLLRVKPTEADEGGVAAGYAVLSSPNLT